MKQLLSFVTSVFILGFSCSAGGTEPANSAGSSPADAVRSFYRWYVTALIANQDPLKSRKEMKRFTTDRLLREIGKMQQGPEGLNGDYFLAAQDFDDLWAKNVTVSNVKISGKGATAEVLLAGQGEMRQRLKVDLANESGTWKIDKVKGLE